MRRRSCAGAVRLGFAPMPGGGSPAKLGILLGSLASGLVGYAVLRLMSPPAPAPQPVRLADGARP